MAITGRADGAVIECSVDIFLHFSAMNAFLISFFFPVSSPTGGTRAIRRLPSANNGNDERFDKNRSTVAVQSAPINGHLGDTSMIYFDFGDRNDSE